MAKDLISSSLARQNILNNKYAIQEVQQAVGISGVMFENEYRFTKKQIAEFFEVTERTIDNCLEKNEKELSKNGYDVLKGNRLMDFKLVFSKTADNEIDFVISRF